MARAAASDFLHSMRFHVTTARAGGGDALQDNKLGSPGGEGAPEAGFMSVSTPEATTEAVEYREGLYNYPRKYPGNTTVSDCSMQKGVAKGDSSFWEWLSVVIHGSGEYRVDMYIKHFDRTALTRAQGGKSLAAFSSTAVPARTYILHEAFPTRHKVSADLDASSSDISVMELDVAYEYFDVVEGTPNA